MTCPFKFFAGRLLADSSGRANQSRYALEIGQAPRPAKTEILFAVLRVRHSLEDGNFWIEGELEGTKQPG